MLPFVVPLTGQSHAEWIRFLGRFHPLLVHLPIGMLLLLPVFEFAGSSRIVFRETAGFVLYLALASAAITLTFGILLAYGDGVTGPTVMRHMWGAIALLVALLVCMAVRPGWISGQAPRVYPALLSVTLIILGWTAHQGGSLTHGGDYLTRYMPGPMKRFFPPAATDAAYEGSAYMRSIHPIFDAKCAACHGASKEQSGLRLDFYDLLMKGGKNGAVIVPGNPDRSLLIERVTLSPSDKHFMPAEQRTPLTSIEIASIRAWIVAGASPTAKNVPGISQSAESAELPFQPVGDYSNVIGEIRAMQSSNGAKLVPVSAKASDGLILRTVDAGSRFDDQQLARFRKFAPFIVEAELARTAVTDASFDTLKEFTNLRALHLEDTAVNGENLATLSSLAQLSYLNLSGTKVTRAELVVLKSMPKLRHIYFFNTPAEPVSDATDSTVGSKP
ncbi:MAG TPA: c-type cytochrome domain-containing protein [Candidatus Sulfotelmatobacter sp.]